MFNKRNKIADEALSAADCSRYARHVMMPEMGVEGQLRLRRGRVLVIGAGGLGSPVLLYLAAAGVGHITVVDGDRVDVSNLQRQVIHSTADICRPKAVSAAESMLAINPGVEVKTVEEFVDAATLGPLVDEADFVIDATDNFDSKFMINDVCVAKGRPYSHGGIFRFKGQAMTYLPGHACYRCLFPEPPLPFNVPAGPMGVLPGVIGAIQATEAIKYLTGLGELLVDRLLTYDALAMEFNTFTIRRAEGCCACSR
ncbi:MAG: HesA/MoeB/ThiF family protein [Muribaculaceae bacterium]|nr:HesA/MoeB/ThiF family protein [Muribaculaceae bacterium]